ncbi:hypothetical protein [Wenyingzhuangia sp. 2_MG-2023]|uniref:hypothetical protein n=1 Tax=Wenyingzhuangia sp. 2_MG-2023 TaxID=3062639 RepID=UPI0026E1E52F|nr:hypothetical protein [Wenyingzhuangia sp. 2_MG-2023]MDO6737506.1 hypothetical protein [Wenyingzhuangia sp. 2_MG-2023]
MMKNKILIIGLAICTLISCGKEEIKVYDNPFVHINFNNVSTVNINANRKDIASYYVYLSTTPLSKDLLLDYDIIVGDGLKDGEDFKILTTEFPLTFPTGIYKRPIQIQWLENTLDPTKDNTITIRLKSNNLGVHIGFPGEDANQSELVIHKVNN